MTLTYAWRLVVRNPRRSFTYLIGLALAVGLFAGVLFFIDATTRQMTAATLAPVRLDLVAHATRGDASIMAMATTLAGQRGVTVVEPVYAADFASAQRVGATTTSPAGRLFALPATYSDRFNLLEWSAGRFDPAGATISEALAIAQHLSLGDRITLTFAGYTQPVTLPVTGIVNLDQAEALFASGAEAENALVADVVLVDLHWFQAQLQGPLAALAANPPASLPSNIMILDPQLHVKIDRAALPSDPTLAALQVESLRRGLERQYPGELKATDNLSAAFKNAKADVLAAKILFVFLGLPGVALAAYLSKFAAEMFAEAQRREISLLRTRGATPFQITAIVAASALLLALGGTGLGLVVGLALLTVSGTATLGSAFDGSAFAASAGWAFLAGLALTFIAAFWPTYASLQQEVTQERRVVRRVETAPLWQRLYLDLILLGAAIVILVVIHLNGGFKPTGNEGAALTLSFYVFLAPLFAWFGSTLLTLRLLRLGLTANATGLAVLFKRVFGDIGDAAGRSIARRTLQVSSAATVMALTLAFGVSLSLFQSTYTTEKRLDAQYLVGADLRLTPALNTPQNADFGAQVQGADVAGVTAIARDTQALVGSEKNTVYGIDVASFRQVAYLPDSFFVDGAATQTVAALRDRTTNYAPGSAQLVLDALAQTPNGVIISVEQAEKYNIQVGDPVRLRLFNRASRTYADVTAQTVGLFIYFPTSSQDSDFILNRDFMTSRSGSPFMDYFLIKTDPTPGAVARVAERLTAQFKNILPVRIQTTETVIKIDSNSLTSLNLNGLGRMEWIYTLLVVSLGLGTFLLAMINERRREFGAMRALGATLGQLRRFLLAEALTIGGLSLAVGAGVGILLARLLVDLLAVVFTIPAQGLTWPLMELSALAGLAVIGMTVSTWLSAQRLGTLKVVEALREL